LARLIKGYRAICLNNVYENFRRIMSAKNIITKNGLILRKCDYICSDINVTKLKNRCFRSVMGGP